MSSQWKRTDLSPRGNENLWMNIMYNTHEQFCSCNDPQLHFMIILNRDSPVRKPESEIKNIKWLLTGKPTTEEDNQDIEEGGFIEGELDRLFQEEGGEKEDTASTTR